MKAETQRIFERAGMKLDWRLKNELPPHEIFDNVVVFTLTGSCTVNEAPVLIDERGPLALTHTADGEVLPFGEVRCDRVRESFARNNHFTHVLRSDSLYGIALGRVMAHELYHMLADETDHTRAGVTRTSLRPDELIGGKLDLDTSALTRIGSRLHPDEAGRKPDTEQRLTVAPKD